jgi:hypothetical protein
MPRTGSASKSARRISQGARGVVCSRVSRLASLTADERSSLQTLQRFLGGDFKEGIGPFVTSLRVKNSAADAAGRDIKGDQRT